MIASEADTHFTSWPGLFRPADEIVCHADVKNAIRTIGQNINVPACHIDILRDVDGRGKSGHDEASDPT